MSASKNRPRWNQLPVRVRGQLECLVAGRVVAAQNCAGGFSPGFASRLTLANGRRVFAKAIDVGAWPSQAPTYRDEARIAGDLTAAGFATVLPTPRFLGSCDDGSFVILAFECAEGDEPARPWRRHQLAAVAAAISRTSALLTPSPVLVPGDHPRLGGWAEIAASAVSLAGLRVQSGWAAGRLDRLIELEHQGLIAARGTTLVHFDALPHNILLTPAGAVLVDWPHARLGAPVIDLLTVLASAAADGIDPAPLLRAQAMAAAVEPVIIDAVLAALTGFWLAGALEPMPPGLAQIATAKLQLGRGGLAWLRQRAAASDW